MKVMIINGSPRKDGITATILQMMENELVEKGAEAVIFGSPTYAVKAPFNDTNGVKTRWERNGIR